MSSTTKKPMRKCVSCMTSFPQEELIRLSLVGDEVIINRESKIDGRGMYVCRKNECIENIDRKKALNRACRRNLNQEMTARLKEELLTVLKEETNVKKS